MKENKFGFSLGIFDIITKNIIQSIEKEASKYECYALGIYTDEFIADELRTACLKGVEDRKAIAQNIEGVSFVFEVNEKDSNNLKVQIQKKYMEYLEKKEQKKNTKHKVGFVIGTYDLLHAGHLENIMIAKEQCDVLAAIVKTDERVFKGKNRLPKQNTEERVLVMSMLKPIDTVLTMDINTTRTSLLEQICSYYNVERKDVALFLGSDLREKESQHMDEWKDINVVFTERDPEKMKQVSSSNYQKQYDEKCINKDNEQIL